jgi:hypothetical protein
LSFPLDFLANRTGLNCLAPHICVHQASTVAKEKKINTEANSRSQFLQEYILPQIPMNSLLAYKLIQLKVVSKSLSLMLTM